MTLKAIILTTSMLVGLATATPSSQVWKQSSTLKEAVDHSHSYGFGHTEAIITGAQVRKPVTWYCLEQLMNLHAHVLATHA